MKFKTSITNVSADGGEVVRGEELSELIRGKSFTETIFLVLLGKLPSENEKKMFDAIFTAEIDHGPAVASAMNARVSVSAGNSVHTALASGILALGDRHGLATEASMKFLYDNIGISDLSGFLSSMKSEKKYVAGIGHKIFTDRDPRATALFAVAKETGIFGKYCEFMLLVCKKINSASSRLLPINVDGAVAAILCDMGIDTRLGKGIFIIGRVPGLIAHIHEEMVNDVGIRRMDQENVEYKA